MVLLFLFGVSLVTLRIKPKSCACMVTALPPSYNTRSRLDNPKQKDFWPLQWKASSLIVFLSDEPGLDKQNTYTFEGQCQANITKGDLIRQCFICDRHGLLVQQSSLLFLRFLLWLKEKKNKLLSWVFFYCCLPFQSVYKLICWWCCLNVLSLGLLPNEITWMLTGSQLPGGECRAIRKQSFVIGFEAFI